MKLLAAADIHLGRPPARVPGEWARRHSPRVAFDNLAEVEVAHGSEMVETLEGGLRLAVARALRDQDIAVDLGPGQILAVLPHTGHRGADAPVDQERW